MRSMKIISHDFEHGEWIPSECAYGKLLNGEFALAENRNPHLCWSNLPEGTRSLVLACIDPDVPTDRNALNAEGEIPADQPRRDFVHWLVWNIEPTMTEVQKGEASVGDAHSGMRFARPVGVEAINDYSSEAEIHRGYDGPCPPGTDARLHGYEFRVYALDVEKLDLPDTARWATVCETMASHVLGMAMIQGIYSLNPRLQP
ncbi:MAG TPA: YbhB/YbcL family Raf kinase inhibitor-like protein [Candidatus Aphodousia gallistercoris]|nr:YbhB/YbcL family Raf kinase inhibitor-like protein [Candidatus Aphodousia gallistercoris]